MAVEALIGFVLCLALYLAARLSARFIREASPQPAFERWIAAQPLVAALRCRPGREIDVTSVVRALLGRGELYNPDGGYPWQHYVVRYACRPVGEGVVGLFATHAVIGRVRDERPTLRELFATLGPEVAGQVLEVWLHGRLKSPGVGPVADREKMSWCGDFDDDGALQVTAMIGHPRWLAPRAA